MDASAPVVATTTIASVDQTNSAVESAGKVGDVSYTVCIEN